MSEYIIQDTRIKTEKDRIIFNDIPNYSFFIGKVYQDNSCESLFFKGCLCLDDLTCKISWSGENLPKSIFCYKPVSVILKIIENTEE